MGVLSSLFEVSMRLLMLLLVSVSLAFPGSSARWTAQTDDPDPVRCTKDDGGPWCRKESVISAPLSAIDRVLSDYANYPRYFNRVHRVDLLEPNLLLVTVNMPSPITDRQWLARFTRTPMGEKVRHSWVPIQLPNVGDPSIVRLKRYAGEWILTPIDATHTHVRITFHGALEGDIPEWTEHMSYNTQGNEMMDGLRAAATAR